MDNARWRRLKEVTWFQEIQAEVTAYVEELRRDRQRLITLINLMRGIPAVQKLMEHLEADEGWIQSVDWGPEADTVEKRAEILLRSMTGPKEIVDTSEL